MKRRSAFRSSTLVTAAALAVCVPAIAAAADKPTDVGRFEYEGACAVCHGVAGKGDGPVVGQLKSKVPDLTVLARENGGVFPFDRVYQVIDGRREVKTHGPREMPIWGRAYSLQSSLFFPNYPPQDAESSVRSRILALTEYVYRLQGR